MTQQAGCLFCQIAGNQVQAYVVEQDNLSVSFLDHRPLFPGHVLVIPRTHYTTLADLPAAEVGPFFERVQRIARAVEDGLGADGSFVAINNRVSQSVPHLHAHVVPRRKKDGLKGFFWPRRKYDSEAQARGVVEALRRALGHTPMGGDT